MCSDAYIRSLFFYLNAVKMVPSKSQICKAGLKSNKTKGDKP